MMTASIIIAMSAALGATLAATRGLPLVVGTLIFMGIIYLNPLTNPRESTTIWVHGNQIYRSKNNDLRHILYLPRNSYPQRV